MGNILIPPELSSPQTETVEIKPPSVKETQPEAAAVSEPKSVPVTDTVTLSAQFADKINIEENEQVEESKEEQLEVLAAEINNSLEQYNKKISFIVDAESHELQALIIDIETNEVLKSIPPDDVLAMREKISEMIGLLVDEFM